MLIYLHVQAGTCLALDLGSHEGPVRHDSCIFAAPLRQTGKQQANLV